MPLISSFEENLAGTDYVVGDIHGAFDKLLNALQHLGFNPEIDRLFSVGDLVDRGDDSGNYLKLLSKPWFYAVRGNHEDMAIKTHAGTWDPYNYRANGGGWWLDATPKERALACEKFNELPFMIEIKTPKGIVGVVHANTRGDSWSYMKSNIELPHVQEHVMWSRDRVWSLRNSDKPISESNLLKEYDGSKVKGIKALIVGHTPMKKVTKIGNVFHIDTAWWAKPKLPVTFINLKTLEVVCI